MTPASSKASKEQVALRVLERLKETWPIIAQDPTLEAALKTHFTRLPRRYALDIHNLEDIRSHVRLLERAESAIEDALEVHVAFAQSPVAVVLVDPPESSSRKKPRREIRNSGRVDD